MSVDLVANLKLYRNPDPTEHHAKLEIFDEDGNPWLGTLSSAEVDLVTGYIRDLYQIVGPAASR